MRTSGGEDTGTELKQMDRWVTKLSSPVAQK